MTTSAFPAPTAPSRLSFARARLYLGISGVGSAVLLATGVLGFGLPARLLSASAAQPLVEALSTVLPFFVAASLIFLPFDVLGGAIVVRERPSVGTFLARWMRGMAIQLAVWTSVAALLMSAARAFGTGGAIAIFVLVQLILATLRAPLARAIASFNAVALPVRVRTLAQRAGLDPERITLVDSADEGFVGGWSGIAARRLVLPSRWQALSDAALEAVLRRRRIIAASGAHRRGVLGAIAWNTLGVVLVLALTGADLATAAGLLTLAAGMTLWAFAGVLLLPTPSRAAVFAVDAAAVQGSDATALGDAIERLDRWQDDEASRSAGVEAVFHPVPSRTARVERLRGVIRAPGADADVKGWQAHHLARHALWLGWGTLSPLSRLVHCNVGRPALWAMLPGD